MSVLAIDHLLDDKYRVVRLVGQGAWATVYEAINVRIQRRVALKVLNIELANKPDLLARFRREAEAATQIESPFVVTIFDAGTIDDGRPYIVMEFLEGESLGARLERTGPLSDEQSVAYAIHLLSGLADAHATGVLHRDIKPDNLIIVQSKNGQEILKLVDFGISKPNVARPEMLGMTKTDVLLGSPLYMSPEQARGTRHMDHRSDLYSVGVVLFEALTHATPHEADNFNELMFKVALEDAPDPRSRRGNIDPALAAMVMKALKREPADRYQGAVEFRAELASWLEHRGGELPPSPYVTSKIRVRAADVPPPIPTDAIATMDGSLPATVQPGPPAMMPSPQRKLVPLVVGAGALLVLLGIGAAVAVTRRAPAPPAPIAATTGAGATSALSAAPAPTPTPTPVESASAVPSALPSASAAPRFVGNFPQPAFRPYAPPVPPRPSGSPAASGAPAPTPVASPTSSTVVEGRTLRTTF